MYTYVYTCVYVCVYIHICIYIFIYTHIQIYPTHIHTHTHMHIYIHVYMCACVVGCSGRRRGGGQSAFLDGYCSTVQGLLDWFGVDLGSTDLLFIQIDLCVMCVFVLCSPVSLSSCPFFGHPALPPPRSGSASRVSPQSCQLHEFLWGLRYSLAVLGVTITRSILFLSSSIHTHILFFMGTVALYRVCSTGLG